MQLKTFRVRKFRNIEDSGNIELLDALTCVVGKNQAGKSALLRALHKFNPHLPDPYDMRSEWPRGQRTQRNKKQAVCEVRFTLSPEDVKKLGEIAGEELNNANVVVTKDYEGNFEIDFLKDTTFFPSALHPTSIDDICQDLPELTDPVGEDFPGNGDQVHPRGHAVRKGWPLRGTNQPCSISTCGGATKTIYEE